MFAAILAGGFFKLMSQPWLTPKAVFIASDDRALWAGAKNQDFLGRSFMLIQPYARDAIRLHDRGGLLKSPR